MVDMHSKPNAPANGYYLAHNNLWGLVLVDQDLYIGINMFISTPPKKMPLTVAMIS